MQKKTINKIISKKVNEWLNTIEDKDLAAAVESNILISGGCIASMFLDQPVNDYDVYLTNKKVLYQLAKYYAKPLKIRVLDGEKKDEIIEDYILKSNTAFNKIEENFSELGVRYRNLKSDQIKLDVSSAGHRMEVMEEQKDAKKYLPVFFSQNAISLTDNLQIVLRFSGTAEEIHKNFDFIHATNYWTKKEGVVINIDAIESILTKDLKYQGSLYPLTSIIRIKKFIKKGWTINAGEMLKIMFQLSDLNLKDILVLEEQLIGVDVAYFSTLINILRGMDTENITSSSLNTIIDKVFNQHDDSNDFNPE